MNQWITLEQTAKHLQISRDSLYKKAQAGKIPASKIGNLWRFDIKEVDAWVRKQRPGRVGSA